MFLTHLEIVSNGALVQVPGGQDPDERVQVNASMYTCLICVPWCLILRCSVGISSARLFCGLMWYNGYHTVAVVFCWRCWLHFV